MQQAAKSLADKIGASIVGSAAKEDGTPRDIDLRIDGKYDSEDVIAKLKAEGYDTSGSSVLTPKEVEEWGKPSGTGGWKRIEHFENKAGRKLDVWHDINDEAATSETATSNEVAKQEEAEAPTRDEDTDRAKLIKNINSRKWYHVPPSEGDAAYAKRGKFMAGSYRNAEFYGRPLNEAQRAKVTDPLVGTEDEIAKELGISPQREGMSLKEIAAHDRKWALEALNQGYDAIVTVGKKAMDKFRDSGKLPGEDMEIQDLTHMKKPKR